MYSSIRKHIDQIISITDQEFDEFKSILSLHQFRRKEALIIPGSRVDTEFYVVKGCIKAYHTSENGDRSIVQFAIEDWWISDFKAFFNNTTAKLTVECIEDSVVFGLKKENLEELYRRIPKFERFFRIKTTRAFISLTGRIQNALEKESADLYLDFCKSYPSIEQRVPNYEIASYLGIKPESLSRIRKEIASNNSKPPFNKA
ncbi:Crp/Fnr family transcriptional regulator [Leeuwenhoekiella aequorea]|uniref:Crp/Fnr family transcriptional regulator n=1 Tax=Leeuwenhoekiella TaxID=283735 RepID=UPI00352C989A|tara:strand:- start:227 stop:832 length:606 start_codon:yes stop_codon:yes gene_type:complete